MQNENWLNRLQNQPHQTRVKILWGTVVVLGIIIVALWIVSIKSNFNDLNPTDITKLPGVTDSNISPAPSVFASVERAEATPQGLKLYMNFNNSSDDILNIPALTNIKLTADNKTYNALQLLDRQGQPFVQKILSHTQNFAVLIFPSVNADTAELVLDQMFLEQAPSQIFKQTIELDLKALKTNSNLRN
jgi:hypothetical protein